MKNILAGLFFCVTPLLAGEPRYKNPTTPDQIYQNDIDLTDLIRANNYGVRSGASATAGFVGEYISSSVTNQSVGTSGQYFNIALISLTPGDWDVDAQISYVFGVATTFTLSSAGIGTVTGNDGTGLASGNTAVQAAPPTATTDNFMCISGVRKSIATTTTFYLKGNATYTGTAPKVYGRISARRSGNVK